MQIIFNPLTEVIKYWVNILTPESVPCHHKYFHLAVIPCDSKIISKILQATKLCSKWPRVLKVNESNIKISINVRSQIFMLI